jgi:hypothetical protein
MAWSRRTVHGIVFALFDIALCGRIISETLIMLAWVLGAFDDCCQFILAATRALACAIEKQDGGQPKGKRIDS